MEEEDGNESDSHTDVPDSLPDVLAIVSTERITWTVESFDPYKTPGPDGIHPVPLQKALPRLLPWLLEIFTKSLQIGHIPGKWRNVRVTFIPKAGKASHTVAKDYRTVSLSSFLLKCLERLVDTFIRENLPPELISKDQHAYLKGKSTETALHEVVGTIEKGLEDKEFTLATFLDIEGAFNNVTTEAIRYGMTRVGVDPLVIVWTINMLTNRKITSTLGDTTITRKATRGTPQGGVISPLLWLLVVNTILLDLKNTGVKTVAYADDVVILARGKYPVTLSEITTRALRSLSNWAHQWGLGVNPNKTELVLFTNKNIIPDFEKPTLGGQVLTLSDKAKYLGVILDRKLNWKAHLLERKRKAYNALYICRRFAGSTWGLEPRICYWLYISVVRPILTYVCIVWWNALVTDTAWKLLTAV